MNGIRTETVRVGDALLYVRHFGQERPRQAPVLLIHGSTVEGDTDWAVIAPFLARGRHVIVPDCRGHGQSTSPSGGYSFQQLAADAAALVCALGYPSAHVVGHSNGGNVALVMLVEHPETVASCVLQAANAYVSDDLRLLEPAKFDADRVDAHDTAWRDQMVALHGAIHGPDYWRQLLRWTAAELISAPNYDVRALERVDRPTLVIEGAADEVNATSGHGSFIARHIRGAELWQPPTGHNVQLERPLDWIRRVEEFWDRRGTPAADVVWDLQRRADPRSTVVDVELVGDPERLCVAGTVLDADVAAAVRAALRPALVPDALTVLADNARPARLLVPLADVRGKPDDDAERVTQVIYGEALTRFDTDGRWTRVRLQHDGYLGWVKSAMLVDADADADAGSDHGAGAIVRADATPVHGGRDGPLVARLPFGARLQILHADDTWLAIRGPTAADWWVRRDDVVTDEGARAVSVSHVIERFGRFVGVPYLWGGRTPYGFDCSGLSQAFWAMLGTDIGRDADQQAVVGAPVNGPRMPGDLVFFRQADGDGDEIVHVGIATDGERYLHASGAAGMTAISSFDERSDAYAPTLAQRYLGARRYEPGAGWMPSNGSPPPPPR